MAADRLGRKIQQRSAQASSAVAVQCEVAGVLQQVVPHDAWCALTVDPATLLPTGGYHEQGVEASLMPRLAEIESTNLDVLSLPALTRSSTRAATLTEATEGQPERSARYRDVLKPSGLRHEVRLLFPAGGQVWGCLILFREEGTADFSSDELDLLVHGTTAVGTSVRRHMVLTEVAESQTPDGPGLVLLDQNLARQHATPSALHWLAAVEDGRDPRNGLPMAVTSVASRARAGGPDQKSAKTRLRTRTGQWLTLHAELLHGDQKGISVIVEPSRPTEVAQIIADAYQLTRRERDVVHFLATGHSRAEMAKALAVSPHTVDDHIKRVYGKLNVRSRAELTSRLFFDQHAPRISEQVPVGGTGWFLH